MIEISIALFIGLLCGIFIQRHLGNQKLFEIDNSVRELESDKRLLQKEIELMKENNKDKTQFKEDMLKEISS